MTKFFTFSLIFLLVIWGVIFISKIWGVDIFENDIFYKVNMTFLILVVINFLCLRAVKNLEKIQNSKPKN